MLKWLRKNLSDEEYVQRARRQVRQLTAMRKPLLMWYGLGFVASLTITFMAFKLIHHMAVQEKVGPSLPLTTFAVGLGFGFAMGFLWHLCLYGIGRFLDDLRTMKLMIKYFDAIQDLAASERGLGGQQTIEHRSASAG